jgi:SAM-dependent methyltransferase
MLLMTQDSRPYLDPYRRAAREHGAGFGTLLWATPQTQAARFAALTRLCDFHGRQVLDAGCGRADFLDYLRSRGVEPAHYVGIEAMDELAETARNKSHPGCLIVRADFVREPQRLYAGAEVVVFCGSLNTLDRATFYATLRHAWNATVELLAFNFLSSPRLAGADYLTWHRPEDVLAFARTFTPHIQILRDYMDGDCTMALRKPNE